MDRITVYYTEDSPHVQIELSSESAGWSLVQSHEDKINLAASTPEPLIAWLIGRSSPIEPYIAAFTERDRLSIGFRIRVIHAERVWDIANQTAEFISSLSPAAYVVAEEAPPHIAQYITNGR